MQETSKTTFFKDFVYPATMEELEDALRVQDSEMHARITEYFCKNLISEGGGAELSKEANEVGKSPTKSKLRYRKSALMTDR